MKTFGCIIIIVFSICIGHYCASMEEKKLRICSEICELLSELEGGLSKRLPLNDVIRGYVTDHSPRYLCGGREELSEVLSGLCRSGICTEPAKLCKKLIFDVSRSPDGAQVQKQCSETVLRSKEIYLSMLGECRKKKELYLRLGAVMGVLVCITVI